MPETMRMRMLEELASLRAQVRALRLCVQHLPKILVGLYRLDGVCVLLEGTMPGNVDAREGAHYSTFLPDERREKFIELFNKASAGETIRSDYPIGKLHFEAEVKPVFDERGTIFGVLFYVRDVTDERARSLHRLDTLTTLARRSVMVAFCEAEVKRGRAFVLVFIDLDGMKRVNDGPGGHAEGDRLLKATAMAMLASKRTADLAARLGGDEFVLVLTGVEHPGPAVKRIQEAIDAAAFPFGASCSIGWAAYPRHGVTVDEVIAEADARMYEVKRARHKGSR